MNANNKLMKPTPRWMNDRHLRCTFVIAHKDMKAKNKYTSLIIDDDPLICDLIEHFCQKSQQITYTLSVGTGKDGLQLLATEKFDLIFLDFNLPDMTAREFLELYRSDSHIIMITSEKDFAADSYNYPQIIDYLVKPVNFERFKKCLEKINHKPSDTLTPPKNHLMIKDGQSLIKVNMTDIQFIKSEGNYISIHSSGKKHMTLMNLSKAEKLLPPYFVKSHRSYLVNLHHVEEMKSEELRVGSQWIPISQSHKNNIIEQWSNLS